ncbi:1-aminocyclopropane-1-carboxylate oxidase11 [Sesamum angolense]|uniref:1-aminocyclopropane-1-carboxylate oxidase11 n=1 Tax=Sesamum angolense TaxID=2727404 RepID=A0AAE2C309_9LAMI|nr:1-aminocyclopropane-1-carboxylate oxidase11 [Sesamum angolense]
MATDDCDYDWEKEVGEFEKTKTGVKGLVDSGITKIVDEIRKASETWGFFQIVNHGVPTSVMDGILESTRRFHEQPEEAKTDLYSSDGRRNVRFYTINGHLKKPEVASWRDAFSCTFTDDFLDPEFIPPVCRPEQDFLERLQCMKSEYLSCLYYPACPEPDRTLGTVGHSDPTILTVLVQDDSGGLQIRHHDDWLDVRPVQGALIVNIGDLLQLITNDKFKSVEHRVFARSKGTRVVGCMLLLS